MTKQVFILNGTATSGKDTFCEILNEFVPTYHYSSIRIPKDIQSSIGNEGDKSEKGRKFLCDVKQLLTDYNDCIFKDLRQLNDDFMTGKLDTDILVIDIREPKEIARAVKEFNAKTILIRNPNVEEITSNSADANVKMYKYDYIIENDGTMDNFREKIKKFADGIMGKRDLENIVIATDFDNTISNTVNYPECGEPIMEVIDYIKDCKSRGATIILWTCREGEYLDMAKEFCEKWEVPIDYYNENDPKRTVIWGNSSRKIGADFYIDDKAILPKDIILKQIIRRDIE